MKIRQNLLDFFVSSLIQCLLKKENKGEANEKN